MIRTVSLAWGATHTAVGLDVKDNRPTLWTTLADSPKLYRLDFSRLEFSKEAPMMSVPATDIAMNGTMSCPPGWRS